MPAHSTLTGADLHEPKGADTASVNTVYVASGSGSGVWKKLNINNLDNTVPDIVSDVLLCRITNVSSTEVVLLPVPIKGIVQSIQYTLGGGITVANASITASNPGVGVMSTTTIPYSSSAEGTTVTQAVSTNNVVSAGSYLKFQSSGTSTTAQVLYIAVVIQRTV